MRLAPFIVAETQAILVAWDEFARSMMAGKDLSTLILRDHADDLLLATVRDMDSANSIRDGFIEVGQVPAPGELTMRLDGASEFHAIGRLGQGFDLMQVVAEYRALRASVLSLWHASDPAVHADDIQDLALFNASIDQSLATAVKCYSKRVDESRDMFLAILSHDLRNPLNAIAMSAQLMPRVHQLDTKASKEAAQIYGSTRVMAKMISDLLDYTRTRLGAGMPIDCKPMDLGQVATDVVNEMRAAHPTVEFRVHLTSDLTGHWDADRIRQVVSNLVGNAVQHGDKRLPIDVAVESNATSVWVSIRNQGTPIPPAEMPRIFDPLVRGAGSTQPRPNRPGSIGLGLYIARELVLAHSGTIEVTSTVRHGTEFSFRLPRHSKVLPPANPGANLDTDKQKALV